ncbi:MAG: hypothetical protein LBQ77_03115 [Treponema sp.]|jgi:hypothetical protein|nr:hypothetical protein [Treponema sp.]
MLLSPQGYRFVRIYSQLGDAMVEIVIYRFPISKKGIPSGEKGMPPDEKGIPPDEKGIPFDEKGIPPDVKAIPPADE